MRRAGFLVLSIGALVAGGLAGAQPAAGDYRIALPSAVEVKPGEKGAVSLTIAARAGYRVSRDAPVIVDLKPTDGLTVAKRRYQRRDAADHQAADPRFDLGFRADRAGDHRLGIELRFWICADRTCRPVRESRSVTVRARAPAPPVDAGVGDAG